MPNLVNNIGVGKVLAVTSQPDPIIELRLKNPLRALHRMHHISGFEVLHTQYFLKNLANDSNYYHVVLLQRTLPEYIFHALNLLNIPYILDIDDNELIMPQYHCNFRSNYQNKVLLTGLSGCSTIISSTVDLLHGLEQESGLPLSRKSYIIPNGLPYPQDMRKDCEPPSMIFWIQSDIAALTESREEVLWAIRDFSNKHKLPVVFIGKNVIGNVGFPYQIVMGEMDFISNLQLLEFSKTGIGVAPLETYGERETLMYIEGKSDLKMLLFDGYGHPGVYSDSPPYRKSSLRNLCTLTSNTYDDWFHALEYQYTEGWKKVESSSIHIRKNRNIDLIAEKFWLPAINSVRMEKPIVGKDLYNKIIHSGSYSSVCHFCNIASKSCDRLITYNNVICEHILNK